MIDGDSGAEVHCQCKMCNSVDVGREVLLKKYMFNKGCVNHTTKVNVLIWTLVAKIRKLIDKQTT